MSAARFAIFVLLATTRADAPTPRATMTLTNSTAVVSLPVFPHVEKYCVQSTPSLSEPFAHVTDERIEGFSFIEQISGLARFYRVEASLVSSNNLLSAIVLNRLAYGPTPDDLIRIKKIGPQAYIDEQLHPEEIAEDPALAPGPLLAEGWEFFSMTGRPVMSALRFVTDDGGPVYLDDICLVRGQNPEVGENLLPNGGFELPIDPAEWDFGRDYFRSRRVESRAHSGRGSFLLQGEYHVGSPRDSSAWFLPQPLDPNETYTLSFWHYRQRLRPTPFFVGLLAPWYTMPDSLLDGRTKLANALAWPADLRAYHTLRAVKARRQLLEILLQFFDNHFVTAFAKDFDFIGHHIHAGTHLIVRHAIDLEFKELERWRAALLKPDCSFGDLLTISCESLAMIFYLDTVTSASIPALGIVPNENYARELLELFTFGADSGYDQRDVTTMSEVWAGWRINIVDPENEYNPLAPRTERRITEFDDPEYDTMIRHNLGVLSFSFRSEFHNPSAKTLFPGKTAPARFGPPYAGVGYQLDLPSREGMLGVRDGYDVISHLADQPFTQEFLSIKLCRLFVHDDFAVGYDFTSPLLSAEGSLVRDCMRAWETNQPKGQIRKVLEVIFNSPLFRTQTAAHQKFKTPLEFAASAVRAFRTQTEDGAFAADTDGYSLEAPLELLGHMTLFDRDSPDGYPETAGPMINVNSLVERIRWIQSYLSPPGAERFGDAGQTVAFPVQLVKQILPANRWRDPGAVADLFLSLLYPGFGTANLDIFRRQAIDFLNTANDGVTHSPFSELPDSMADYDVRLRGMVAHLMSLAQFNQQ
jgi:uncharacterized protein (DUF1800 family)